MSTLPSEYFEFKSVWESIPLAERTVKKLTERLRLIEMRLPERRSDSSALTVNEKKDKKNADKSDKRPERKEQRKCFKCHKKRKLAGEAFLCERDDRQDDQWLADSGASAHMTNNKSFFLSYEPFNYPREVQVGNNEIIHAYGEEGNALTSHQTEKVAVNDEPLKEGENDIEVTTSEEAVVKDGNPTSSSAKLEMDVKKQQRDTKKPAYLRDYVYLAECDAPDSYAAAMKTNEAEILHH
ncbi:hypothetical protein QE152_g28553 [Popillia japonica]|uniref:Retrovirus-related Pol polyprotein from transposon TNT 1-94-like beta-barrel domain-containing protein n=1 Tax=Popillia japonica TaxID=7064 RepID=A0AAW1JIE0_POPJA